MRYTRKQLGKWYIENMNIIQPRDTAGASMIGYYFYCNVKSPQRKSICDLCSSYLCKFIYKIVSYYLKCFIVFNSMFDNCKLYAVLLIIIFLPCITFSEGGHIPNFEGWALGQGCQRGRPTRNVFVVTERGDTHTYLSNSRRYRWLWDHVHSDLRLVPDWKQV